MKITVKLIIHFFLFLFEQLAIFHVIIHFSFSLFDFKFNSVSLVSLIHFFLLDFSYNSITMFISYMFILNYVGGSLWLVLIKSNLFTVNLTELNYFN